MISWHRFYDPETGRYISADPIGLAGGMNLYAYANQNPIGFIDPEGLSGYLFTQPGTLGSTWPVIPVPPPAWYNDPNHWTQGSINLGAALGWSACVSVCMAPYVADYMTQNAIEKLLFTMYGVASGGSSTIITGLSYISWGRTSFATKELYEQFLECRCKCEEY